MEPYISTQVGCSIIIIVISVICLFLSYLFCIIHLKVSLLKQAFFNVVFGVILLELFINLMLIINTSVNLITIHPNIIFNKIIGFINCFLLTSHVSYYIIMIILFFTRTREKEASFRKGRYNSAKSTESNISSSRYTVKLSSENFLYIHIPSIIIGLSHATIAISTDYLSLFTIPFSYITIASIKTDLYFFIQYYLFFLIAIPYSIISCNENQISSQIRLKHFGIYCLCLSILWLVLPACYIIQAYKSEWLLSSYGYIPTIIFEITLISNVIFHLRSYYITNVLNSVGEGFWLKVLFAIKIMLFIEDVPEPNFVDCTSSYIFHSLLTISEFSSNENELDVSCEMIS